MSTQYQQQFIRYLQNELEISDEAIALALRCQKPSRGPLHMVLWQHGLIDIEQLERAFEWRVIEKIESKKA